MNVKSSMTSWVNLTVWEEALMLHFGKKAKQLVMAILSDVLIVDHGIKPAYLWDLCHPNADKVTKFLQELHLKAAISSELKVLIVGDDVFVVHMSHLISHLEALLDHKQCYTIVDISQDLESPVVAKKTVENELKTYLFNILSQLKSFQTLSNNLNESEIKISKIQVQNSWNLSTIFGAFLGYPVLYFFSSSKGNCLALCPLRVYSIVIEFQNHLLKSQHSFTKHTVYSFSVPDALTNVVANLIELWFSKLYEKSKPHNFLYVITLHQKIVAHPTVTL